MLFQPSTVKKLLPWLFLGAAMVCLAAGQQIDFLASGLTDTSGNPLSGGLVYTYAAGTTASKSTFLNASLATTNTNPIVLDAYGRALAFGSGRYKFVIKTATGTTLYTWDGLTYSNSTTVGSGFVNSVSTAGQTTINLGSAYTNSTDRPKLYINGVKQLESDTVYTWSPPTITIVGTSLLAGWIIEAGY